MAPCFKNILITISNSNFTKIEISHLKVYNSKVIKNNQIQTKNINAYKNIHV